jgi:TetR/AcrR family transcriptional regulator, transcriptional repressor for nem operon
MARPKQFDPDEVMQEALDAFWERGYGATSVQDLLEEMGLNRGSLYGTFGDKKKLFLAVLDKYYQQRVEDFDRVLNEPASARQALRDLLTRVGCECTGDDGTRGCLAAKAAMELAPHDKDVAGWLRRFHRRNVAMLASVIERGQQQGEISRKLDAESAARFVLNNIAGLRLLGTTSPSAADVKAVIELVLKVLD